MSNLTKTISYLKRNGIRNTWYAVWERTDHIHMDEASKRALAYKGREALSEATKKEQKERIFLREYTFSILVPTFETDEVFLREMIESVLNQTYSKLQLVIADASDSEKVRQVVDEYEDGRITYLKLAKNGGISANTNAGLAAATGDYIGLLDHDDLLTPDALYEMMCQLQKKEYAFLYSDEDKMDGNGKRFYEPHFKPEFNLDLLTSNNYICHFLVMRAELMKQLKFRPKRDGAQDYDLVLRAVTHLYNAGMAQVSSDEKGQTAVPVQAKVLQYVSGQIAHLGIVLYHWRCHENSTAANPESKRYAYEAGLLALQDFADEMKWAVKAVHSLHLGFYELQYLLPVFTVRKEIAAIGGRVIKHGKVTGSPKLSGVSLFQGLFTAYSGYMHRADMYMDVDELDRRCMKVRPELTLGLEEAKEAGMILLYDPAFCVKESDA